MKMQIIPDIVNQQGIIALETSATVHDAVQAMTHYNVSAIIITDKNNKMVGIVSERDMTHRVLACGLNPQSAPVSNIMSKDLKVITPEDSALDAIEMMIGGNIRHLPVVAEDGKVLAMVSIRDLLKAALRDLDIDISQHLKTTSSASIKYAPLSS